MDPDGKIGFPTRFGIPAVNTCPYLKRHSKRGLFKSSNRPVNSKKSLLNPTTKTLLTKPNKRPLPNSRPGCNNDQKLIADLYQIRSTRMHFFPKINKRPGSSKWHTRVVKQEGL